MIVRLLRGPSGREWPSLGFGWEYRSGRLSRIDGDLVTREAHSHEVISFGFWPGDDTIGDAACYSDIAPEPPGLREQALPAGPPDAGRTRAGAFMGPARPAGWAGRSRRGAPRRR